MWCFLRLEKSFWYKVDHNTLLTKLEHYGFRCITRKWIRLYLLRPLFFLLNINDLQKCRKYSKSFIFTDDTALLMPYLKNNRKRMNIDLKLLHHWLCSNKIGLNNVFKTETILFRHPKKMINYDLKLKLHGKRLCLGQKYWFKSKLEDTI